MAADGPIVVPLDGSELAEQAVPVAAALAGARGGALDLVHVHLANPVDPIYVEGLPVIDEHLHSRRREHEHAYLTRVQERLAPGPAVATFLLDGQAAPALAEHARSRRAWLLLLTTHGRGGFERAWLGSVADDLIQVSPVPLLLLRPEPASAPLPFRRILVPLDGSALAETILEHVVRFARAEPGTEVVLLEVVPPIPAVTSAASMAFVTAPADEALTSGAAERARTYLEGIATRLSAQGLRVRTRVEVAPRAGPAVLDAVRAQQASLVALSTHGRSGLRRVALGSVADKLVRGSHTPVLLFRPAPEAAKRSS